MVSSDPRTRTAADLLIGSSPGALGGSINQLYDTACDYAALAEDRDFGTQSEFLSHQLMAGRERGRHLELFAGPARHSAELARRCGHLCVAIDSSPDMRRLAVESGSVLEKDYHLACLPRTPAIAELGGPFDGVSILRYSIGYLNMFDVSTLFCQIARLLAPHGRVAVELHDLDLVRSDFSDLAIRERIVGCGEGYLRCVWPLGPLRWSSVDWVAEMDVLIQYVVGDKVISEKKLTSIERIYSAAEVVALACQTGYFRRVEGVLRPSAFGDSTLLILERSIKTPQGRPEQL